MRKPSMAHAIVAALVAMIATSRARSIQDGGRMAKLAAAPLDAVLPVGRARSAPELVVVMSEVYPIRRHRGDETW